MYIKLGSIRYKQYHDGSLGKWLRTRWNPQSTLWEPLTCSNTIIFTFRDWIQRIGLRVCFPYSDIAQITLS